MQCWVRQITSGRATGAAGALVVWAGLLVGCSTKANDFSRILNPISSPSPTQVARDAFDIYDADLRRNSVSMLSAAPFGGEGPYLRLYRLLVDDPDATVRAACIRAIGLHGTGEDVPMLAGFLERDGSSVVRWEAAKALQKINSPQATDVLVRALGKDPDVDVRIASAYALGQYAEPRVYYALVGALDDQDFAVTRTSRKSLRTLSGQDFGADGGAWLRWAQDHPDGMFARQTQYVWWPYEEPIGFWDKAKFWKTHQPVQPRLPRGQIASASEKQAGATQ